MSASDFMEWMTVLMTIPIALLAVVFRLATALYVYFDAEERSKNRAVAAGLAAAVAFWYWPIGYLAYVACTVVIDRRRLLRKAA